MSEDFVTVDIKKCARCGKDHGEMRFHRFKGGKCGEYGFWASCPSTGEPVLMRMEHLSKRPDGTHSVDSQAGARLFSLHDALVRSDGSNPAGWIEGHRMYVSEAAMIQPVTMVPGVGAMKSQLRGQARMVVVLTEEPRDDWDVTYITVQDNGAEEGGLTRHPDELDVTLAQRSRLEESLSGLLRYAASGEVDDG